MVAGFKRQKKKYDFSEEKNDIVKYNPIFDYSNLELEIQDKDKLISLEKKIVNEGAKIGEIACKIGESLELAREVFKKYSTEENDPNSFVTWYFSLGLNKDQVYLFRGRYNLSLEYPNYLNNILSLSNRAIKETINKKTPKELKEKVVKGGIITGKAIVEERNILEKIRFSSVLEKEESEIIEAEIIETKEEKIIVIDKELSYLEKDIKEREKNLKKLYIQKEDFLKKKDNLQNGLYM
ncbi:hypothetical protein [Psychrilyobacter sp.]|uniref:hypothetical protein n=1 Tax=Psychrilyobacter sp. TaxID=2586924 RepID=UPI00301A8778